MDKENRIEQAARNIEVGEYLKSIRDTLDMSLLEAGKTLGISSAYLSEIERGAKSPTDTLLSRIAEVYKVDEIVLFNKYNKIHPSILLELYDNEILRNIIIAVREHGDKKQQLCKNILGIIHEETESR